jgi:DHA2 family multidrug resistance protein
MSVVRTTTVADTAKIYNPTLIAAVVSLATFMEVLDTTITNVSLSHIAGTLGASQDESTWVLTSYLVANGIVLPLSGWLSGVMGRKRFFMTCIACFTAASFLCGMANSLPMLIIFRLVQGLAGGGLQPTQQAIIVDAFPPEKRGAAFGITGLTMIVAPILGPTLGGFITDNFSWRWIFFMNVPVGMLAFWLVGRMVQDPPHAHAKGLVSIDYIGLSLIGLGLGVLQIVLDKGQQEDWFASHFIIICAFISAACLIGAVVWLLRQEDPVIDLRLLTKPSFSLSCLMIFFMGFCLYGSSTLLPLLVQSEYGYDATLAGLVLSPGGFAVIFLMPIAGRLVSRIESRYLICTGMLLLTVGLWYTMRVTPQTNYGTFVLMRILQVLGLPFLFIPISTLAFMDIPKEKSSKASAIYALSRNMGGSIGIALTTSYLLRHKQMHQSFLTTHLAPEDSGFRLLLAKYTHFFFSQGQTMVDATHSAMGRIYSELLHQSTILAYRDTFMAMAIVTFIMAIIALMMPRNNPHKKPAAAEAAAH